MDSHKDLNLVEVLPEDVLSEIFMRLDFKSVINASLVCYRWSWIVFTNYNIKRFRFILRASLFGNPEYSYLWYGEPCPTQLATQHHLPQDRQAKEEQKYELINLIEQSQRSYRHMNWYIPRQLYRSNVYFFEKSISALKTQHLLTLRVDFANKCGKRYMFDTLARAIRLMPQLQSLEILNKWHRCSRPKGTRIKLHSESLRYLRLDYPIPATFDMPALESLNVTHAVLQVYDNDVQWENLKHLIIRPPDAFYFKPLVQQNIYDRLTNLEAFEWLIRANQSDFISVCITSTRLNELTITEARLLYDINFLSNLTHLRRLSLCNLNVVDEVRFDLSKLSNLEYLRVEALYIYPAIISHLPASIVKFQLCVNSYNECDLMDAITLSMTQLTELIIVCGPTYGLPYPLPSFMLEVLPRLNRLEVFKIHYKI